MKKTVISLVASSVVAGVILTGCGSSSSGGTTSSNDTANLQVQASNVNFIAAGGLAVQQGTTSCTNDENLTANNNVFTLRNSQFGCSIDVANDFNITVQPALAWFDLNSTELSNPSTANSKKLNKKLSTPLEGEKGKRVNIFSTIAKKQGKKIEDIDANNENVKAIKDIYQAAFKIKSDFNVTDVNVTNIANVANGTDKDDNLTKVIPTSVITDLNTTLGLDLSKDSNLTKVKVLKIDVDENGTAKFSIDDDVKTKLGLENNDISDINDTLSSANTNLEKAAVAPNLTVSEIGLEFGGESYTGTKNKFIVTRTPAVIDTDNQDIKIKLKSVADNNYSLTDTELVAKIATTNEHIQLNVTDINITSDENGKVSATIAKGANVTLSATSGTGVDSIPANKNGEPAKLDKTLTSTDLSFSIDELISNITTNTTGADVIKNQLLNHINRPGTYDVSVGLKGGTESKGTYKTKDDVNATTNLNEVTIDNNDSVKGFEGTVIIKELTDAQKAKKAEVVTNLNTANSFNISTYTGETNSTIDSASDATALETAKNDAETALNDAITAAQAVIDSGWASSAQVSEAKTQKSTLESYESSIESAVTAKQQELYAEEITELTNHISDKQITETNGLVRVFNADNTYYGYNESEETSEDGNWTINEPNKVILTIGENETTLSLTTNTSVSGIECVEADAPGNLKPVCSTNSN